MGLDCASQEAWQPEPFLPVAEREEDLGAAAGRVQRGAEGEVCDAMVLEPDHAVSEVD
jgi:hypothetical protein